MERINPIARVLKKQDGSRLSQYLAAASASIVLFTAGLHLGWPAPSLEIILSTDYPHSISNDEGSYIVIVSFLGHVIGGVSGSALADLIGRKWTMLSIAVPQLTAMGMIYASNHSKYLLYSARILGGIGEGAALVTLPTYIAEVAEPEIRGFLGSFTSFVFVLGVLFINLLGSHVDMYTTALICMAFPILYWLIFINFPDTPYYHLMKRKPDEAVESLRVLRRKKSVWKEVENLTEAVGRQMSESGTYADLFKVSSNRKAFFLVSAMRFFQQFTGAPAYALYSHLLIGKATNVPPIYGSSLLMVNQMMIISLSSLFIDKFGRRILFTISSGLCCLLLFVQGTLATLKTYNILDMSNLQWLPFLVMVFLLAFFNMGLGVGYNVFVSEIYSSSIRAKALSLGSVVFSVTMMGSIKYYQYTADNFGHAVTFYSFGICTFIGTLFFYFCLPETKGKTLEDIQQDLKGTPNKKMPLRTQA